MADYGDAGLNGVAGLTKPYTNSSGVYDATTNPTLTQVENWLDEISSAMNAQLGNMYFVTPVTAAAALPMLNNFANQQVAKLIEQEVRNRSSRGPTTRNASKSQFELMQNVETFIRDNARGIESNGASRNSQIIFRTHGFYGTS